MPATITVRTDAETERALEILTRDGATRSAVVRAAIRELAMRREAAESRRAVLRMPLGRPDGVNVADELAKARQEER